MKKTIQHLGSFETPVKLARGNVELDNVARNIDKHLFQQNKYDGC